MTAEWLARDGIADWRLSPGRSCDETRNMHTRKGFMQQMQGRHAER
jgi:hypothetical protein